MQNKFTPNLKFIESQVDVTLNSVVHTFVDLASLCPEPCYINISKIRGDLEASSEYVLKVGIKPEIWQTACGVCVPFPFIQYV